MLAYLREELGRTGTKKGCAERDYGACTEAVGELAGGRIRVRAVNSCRAQALQDAANRV